LMDGIDSSINFTSNTPAIISNTVNLSYNQLIGRASALSNYFIQKGISQNMRVGILAGNSVEFIFSILALWNMGAVPVPVNIRLTDSEICNLLDFAEIKFLVSDKDVTLPDKNLISTADFINLNRAGYFNVDMNSSSPALIMFTSGSTGLPKAVVHSFDTLLSSVKISHSFFSFNSGEHWLASLPFYHIGGFQIFMRAFLTGSAVIIPEEIKNEFLLEAMFQHRPAYASLVSTQLKEFVDAGIKPVDSLKYVLLGGGFIPSELLQRAKVNGWRTVKVYGSTETASLITALENNEKINSAGRPLPSVEIKILNDNGEQLEKNKIGEITVKSPSLFIGYFNNDEEYKIKFKDNFYSTGDFGHLDEEGYLYVEARRTDLIISGGENISPFEVEDILLSYPGIAEAVVFQMEDNKWGHIPAAALVLTAKINADVLLTFLRERLADFKVPRRFFYLEELPKTSLGKIEKEKVKQICSTL
ncbi:MAG: o-succinylbenzoate--CoA ligase, partial [Ignavibacteriaceae bacterium]|nr:o-succinylbenzoate--CoA ligase [Ignavibacteriaceae bacterium]